MSRVPRLLIDVYSSPSLDDILSGVIDGERKLAEIAFDDALGGRAILRPMRSRNENRWPMAIANSDSPNGRSTRSN
jgi:hypothetical protein